MAGACYSATAARATAPSMALNAVARAAPAALVDVACRVGAASEAEVEVVIELSAELLEVELLPAEED